MTSTEDYLKRMIHVFYTYAGFALDELKKLEDDKIIQKD